MGQKFTDARGTHRRETSEPGRRDDHPLGAGPLFEDRGVQLDRTMQLNVGGNMDFNMLERNGWSPRSPKTQPSLLESGMSSRPRTHTARPTTSDGSTIANVRLEGRAFEIKPLNLEYKLEVWDRQTRPASSTRCGEDRQGPRHRR